MNQVQITLPNEPQENIDSVLFLIQETLGIKNLVLLKSDNNSVIILRRKRTEVAFVMEKLTNIGVGVDFGIIDIVPLSASIPEVASIDLQKEDTPEEELKSRVSLQEINAVITDISKTGVNFYIYIVLASLMAGAGLIMNSTTAIIASMILSPFMGPILAVSYGTVIKKRDFVILGLKGQTAAIGVGIGLGFVMGLINRTLTDVPIFTDEMLNRTWPSWLDVLVAVCAGIAVGFSITGGLQSALVGIAVAVALLPPVVNTGLVLALGSHSLALGSFVLMITNVIVVNLCAYLVFKLKRLRSLPATPWDWMGPIENKRPKKDEEKEEKKKWTRYAFWR